MKFITMAVLMVCWVTRMVPAPIVLFFPSSLHLYFFIFLILLSGFHSLFAYSALQPSLTQDAAELKHGRYIGWIEFTERKERIAVVVEFFLESPEDLTKFPGLNAVFKLPDLQIPRG